MDEQDDFFDMLAKSPTDGAEGTNSTNGGGNADDGGEVDFFELLNISHSRLDGTYLYINKCRAAEKLPLRHRYDCVSRMFGCLLSD